MSSIDVFIYSYKGKHIKTVLESIFNFSSNKNKINLWLLDQHPINREKQLLELYDIKYSHVFWDWQISPCIHKKDSVKFASADYFMIVSDNIKFSQNWDESLINFINKNDCIVSGNHKVDIENKNLFFIKKNKNIINDFVLNNFIDRDLIFGKTTTIKKINYPQYLKYNGEEEALSLQCFVNDISIFSAPSDLYTNIDEPSLEKYYSPFSINHNYNEVINLFKIYKNKYHNLLNKKEKVLEFYKYHNFNFGGLEYLPFDPNDVAYNPEDLNFNRVDARKFVARTKAIH